MTRDGGGKSGKAGRQLTDEEAELWQHISRSVEKAKAKSRVPSHAELAAPASGQPPAPAKRAAAAPPGKAAPALPAPPQRSSRPLPAADFNRRELRQVSAGKVAIDGKLDLHGLHQDTAHARLRAFLVASQAKGHRMVLVITGKGAGPGRHDDHEEPFGRTPRGVLRRSVPMWLEEPDLRAVVLSYASAGVRHGGGGALYVRLRKARGT
ncbi:MAG TPA: Smr/MutS family protein [Hyphomicrobiaceae bacterium]|nr:Smr/MutS family protein [Hyphomicrobiaceae bacterium]